MGRVSFILPVLFGVVGACSSAEGESPPTNPLPDGGTDAVADAGAPDTSLPSPSSDATLSELSLSAATLTPAFSPATLAYTVDAPFPALFANGETTVTAKASAAGASVSVNGKPSAPIALKIGATSIDVEVTAPDAVTKKHYTIAVSARALDYLKASNTRAVAGFGHSVAVSGDTLVVGSPYESSKSTGVNGDQSDTSEPTAGAAYVFRRSGGTWKQEAYLKASNAGNNSYFGTSIAIDKDTIVVGAHLAESAYVFTRTGTTWSQQALLKASNSRVDAHFGVGVAIEGNTIVVGSNGESSSATGIDGNQADTTMPYSGAAYVFTRTGIAWSQQAYVKTSNTAANANFGNSIAVSGNTMVVGSSSESTTAAYSGAAYVFTRTGATWSQQTMLKASNARPGNNGFGTLFGASVAIAGNTVAVGSTFESSASKGVNGDQDDASADRAGAVYVFTRAGTAWSQQAYVKASNARAGSQFGSSVALVGDSLAVGSWLESSSAKLLNGDQADASMDEAGSAYLFRRTGTTWAQRAYVKAPNTRPSAFFGFSVALSAASLVVGSHGETSNAKGVNGDAANTSANGAGAAYVFF